MHTADGVTSTEQSKSTRLHYLDWLHVLAILGVFLFHAVHPFDYLDWHIKNAEQSLVVTMFVAFFVPWGMPFFFLMSGARTWFSLRRRSGKRFVRERVLRLLVPLVIGSILLTPIQFYFEKLHEGRWAGPFLQFILRPQTWVTFFEYHPLRFGPSIFGALGYHLWFLGFLMAYSMIALPLLLWLKGDGGGRLLDRLSGLCERRGGILAFVVPLAMIRLALQPFFPQEHDWADFAFTLAYFALGYILYAERRLLQALRRDVALVLAVAIVGMAILFALSADGTVLEWMTARGTAQFFFVWVVFTANSWSWCLLMLQVGMRFFDFSNGWLRYGREAGLPFFLLHQPVILGVAYKVVQWQAGVMVKLLAVVGISFVVTLTLYELLVRRIPVMRTLFGVKAPRRGANLQ